MVQGSAVINNEKHKDLIKDWALSSAAVVLEERKPMSTPGFHNSEVYTSSSHFLHAQNINFFFFLILFYF